MINRLFIYILICGLSVACQKTEKTQVDKDTMVKILADMHVSDAVLANVNPGIKDSVSKVYLDEILKIHNVKKTDFDKAIKYYESKPEILETMYEDVLKRLENGTTDNDK